jgi:hypothetical protein
MLQRVGWYLVTGVSGQNVGSILMGQSVFSHSDLRRNYNFNSWRSDTINQVLSKYTYKRMLNGTNISLLFSGSDDDVIW